MQVTDTYELICVITAAMSSFVSHDHVDANADTLLLVSLRSQQPQLLRLVSQPGQEIIIAAIALAFLPSIQRVSK